MLVKMNYQELKPEQIEKIVFDLETWLNKEVALQAFEKFGAGLRTHLTLVGVGE